MMLSQKEQKQCGCHQQELKGVSAFEFFQNLRQRQPLLRTSPVTQSFHRSCSKWHMPLFTSSRRKEWIQQDSPLIRYEMKANALSRKLGHITCHRMKNVSQQSIEYFIASLKNLQYFCRLQGHPTNCENFQFDSRYHSVIHTTPRTKRQYGYVIKCLERRLPKVRRNVVEEHIVLRR